MKKNVGKKFRLMALLTSLALLLWGGVTACSNGSDDTGTSVKLKGAFFEEGDDETPWVYCAEQLTEKENGIWEGEITSVNSEGWDHFGVEVNGTWYGAEEGLEGDITDAKLVKDGGGHFWLATEKGGKTKVTIDLNKMTITVVDANPNDGDNDGSEDVEAVEFSYTYEASKISNTAASITITVTEITSTTDNAWEFWAITNASDKDEIKWKSGEGAAAIYELTIKDATKIAYLKEKGIAIKGAKGLSATVTVTVTKTDPTATPPTDGDETVKPGEEGDGDTTDDLNNPDSEKPNTLPTVVVLKSKIDDSGWKETAMTKSATDGIWTCKLTVSKQWTDFQVKATIGGKNSWYKGESGKGTGVTLGSDPATMSTGEESEEDNLYCYIGEKCNGAEISVTVDFTDTTKPSIKIKLVQEGTVSEDKKPLATKLPIENISLSGIKTEKPGILVAEGTVFSDVDESNTITITITYNNSATTLDTYATWYCYTIDGESWKGDFEKTGGKTSVTITGADITALKSGSLTIYGNNTDATVTVTYE